MTEIPITPSGGTKGLPDGVDDHAGAKSLRHATELVCLGLVVAAVWNQ